MQLNNPISATVSILTCNRKDILLELLGDLKKQTMYGQFEIIVVDNNSSDGTEEAIEKYYPEVKYFRNKENTGCAGRNVGLREATGNIVITLDDDVYFHRKDEIERIIALFVEEKEAAAINFKILFHDSKKLIPFNWYHPRRYEDFSESTFETDYISEGAVAFQRKIFKNVRYYPEEFFLGHEGYDLAYRIIDHGYKILYSSQIEVIHRISMKQRDSWRNTYYDTRNYIWLIVRHFPLGLLLKQLSYRICTTFLNSLLKRQIGWYFRALKDAVKGLPTEIKKRKVLKKRTIDRLKEIHRFEPGPVSKMKAFTQRMFERKINHGN
jgi:GT2 family glycosyltransferase